MAIKWSRQVPKQSGWYWIRYKAKRGVSVSPALLYYDSKTVFWITAIRIDFYSSRKDEFKKYKLVFGPEIEEPDWGKKTIAMIKRSR